MPHAPGLRAGGRRKYGSYRIYSVNLCCCLGYYYLFILNRKVHFCSFFYGKGIGLFLGYPDSDTASEVEGFALEQIYKPIVLFFINPFIFALRADFNSDPYSFFNLLAVIIIAIAAEIFNHLSYPFAIVLIALIGASITLLRTKEESII